MAGSKPGSQRLSIAEGSEVRARKVQRRGVLAWELQNMEVLKTELRCLQVTAFNKFIVTIPTPKFNSKALLLSLCLMRICGRLI